MIHHFSGPVNLLLKNFLSIVRELVPSRVIVVLNVLVVIVFLVERSRQVSTRSCHLCNSSNFSQYFVKEKKILGNRKI